MKITVYNNTVYSNFNSLRLESLYFSWFRQKRKETGKATTIKDYTTLFTS